VYNISAMLFSPDDIEHAILRANSLHPSQNRSETSSFLPWSDKRTDLALSTLDPRIHFILNCGAKSCPPIKVLSSSNPAKALQRATEAYLKAEVRYDQDHSVLYLPKLALWYGLDFGPTLVDQVKFLLSMWPAGAIIKEGTPSHVTWSDYIVDQLQQGTATVQYNDYNWDLNIAK